MQGFFSAIGRFFGSISPSSDQVGGVTRALIAAAVGWAVGKDLIPAAYANELIVALVGLVTLIWTIKTNSQKAMIASVADKGNVVVTPDAKMAASIPDDKVVSATQVKVVPIDPRNPYYPDVAAGSGTMP